MLLCLFVFLWKMIKNMSTITATIQQEQQLELLKQQLIEHQRRKLCHLRRQSKPVPAAASAHYQKLRKLCRERTSSSAKENFMLHRFLFGDVNTIPENGPVIGGGGEQQLFGAAETDRDKGSFLNEEDRKFLRMSEHPNRQNGKCVLSQQNQYFLNRHQQHPPPPPSAVLASSHNNHPQRRYHQQQLSQQQLSQQNSPNRRPLASNVNFWSNNINNNNSNNSNCNLNGNALHTTPTGPGTAALGCFFGEDQQHQRQNAGDADLSDGNLKSNVQIVLDNINRNYHALRGQILSNHHQQQQLVVNNSNKTNNNNFGNEGGFGSQANNLVLLQRLQSVSQQLKKGAKMASPDSDTNCNPYLPAPPSLPLSCSIASSQDFSHDYSDYQWFMDYGSYRDGVTHQSILSALSASYNGIGELSYYEDLAKNIDANLAEVDMENFHAEDIHSLLTTLPTMCSESAELRRAARNNNRGELMMMMNGSGGAADGTGTGAAAADMDNSICKSELLFSPVRESHISVDSLDMDGYPDEDDIILTCQANKNNYTIAFEQSLLYSDESFYDGPENYGKYKQMNLLNNLDHIIRKKAQETTMSVSEVGYTTWSKLRKNGPNQRLPLAATNPLINQISRHAPSCFVRKSLSMPDLKENCDLLVAAAAAATSVADAIAEDAPDHHHGGSNKDRQLNVSQAANSSSTVMTSGESYGKQMRTLLPMYPVPTDFRPESPMPLKDSNLNTNEEQTQNQPSFNLVKLFIKQKSSSTDTCMDVSSGCWPSDSTNSASGGENNNNSNTNLAVLSSKDRTRKKSMNDSGKCSTLGRHEEEEFQFDSLDAQINNNNNNNNFDNNGATEPATATGQDKLDRGKLNDFNSPVHKRNYKSYNLNIANKNVPVVNPLVYNLMNNNNSGSVSNSITNNNNNNNNNNSFKDTNSDASRTSENLTQIFNSNNNNNNSNSSSNGSKTKVPIEMITKSMQTSFIGSSSGKEKVRIIPPSFLDRLNKLGDKQKAPVFVVYPNYVLPDLSFLKAQNDVVISPISYKESVGKRAAQLRKPRPVSMNDIENIKAKDYKHVVDWQSLITLLPPEYRKLLRNIPEANAYSIAEGDEVRKPLFCMTPPLRRGRGVTCDCVNILNNTQTYNSSSSGGSSSQPPSSGYRGSSTMLTDSEMDMLGPGAGSGGFNNNLYVYQYDSPAEVTSAERPPSGRVAPKSILRKASSAQRQSAKVKRNSMFEENQKVRANVEKRRSLQEPCYNFSEENLILEQSIDEMCEAANLRKVNNSPNMSQHHQARLPNTPKLPSADDYHRLNKLNELNDLELNKAVSSKLNRAQQQQQLSLEDDLDARIRAENFLSSVPKTELKHYAELAHILEMTTNEGAPGPLEDLYERTRLRHEVSRALFQRKNVSFDQGLPPTAVNTTPVRHQQPQQLLRPTDIRFSTPPNSPNMMSVVTQKPAQKPPHKPPVVTSPASAEREKQDKIQSNRFRRLQIQWELLSKEGQHLKQELQQHPRSGGNTPTTAGMKSRIPRPVSYPTTRANSDPVVSKTLRSPSRIVPPKKYNPGSAANLAAAVASPQQTTPPMPAPRTPSKLLHTTPKKTAPAPAPATPRIPLVGSGGAGGGGGSKPPAASATATAAAGKVTATVAKPVLPAAAKVTPSVTRMAGKTGKVIKQQQKPTTTTTTGRPKGGTTPFKV
ncbi:uncharacterized protein DDB_G0283357 isoform X2 [Sabethes cyaneus]|uniref:uncharacterized protein DDB_G0283357 isoform X2 n=1 Tax=Sabethes cyaneus TaxID=53552 RepID=UPI00237E05B0|nr:uncharacterized protein DDB_G0283357 isoform X2 [Sabethes cyaneus]